MRTHPPTLERLETRVTPTAAIVKDIIPGPVGSIPSNLTAVGGMVYFNAGGLGHPELSGLWKSDGTPRGTMLVRSFTAAEATGDGEPTGFTPFKGKVYFLINDNLWMTDGTPAGTVALSHLPPNLTNDILSPPAVVGDSIYFTDEVTLYKSDGTAAGTTAVVSFGGRSVGVLTAAQLPGQPARLYFTAADQFDQYGLYQSDGTAAGTTLVESLAARSAINAITQVGPALYFSVWAYPEGSHAQGLWKTDGTAAGTTQLTIGYSDIGAALNGKLFFVYGLDPAHVWETDGTPEGTLPVPGAPNVFGMNSERFVRFGNALYFSSYEFTTNENPIGGQLWRTDGTAAGTVQVTMIPAGSVSNPFVVGAGPGNGAIYFANYNGTNPALGTPTVPVLFQTDGTTAGIKVVRRISGDPHGFGAIVEVAAAGSTLFFTNYAPTLGIELWATKPTPKAQVVAVGAGVGGTPLVKVYDAATGRLKFNLLAAPSNFRGGVRVAVGDVNGDGVDDIITGAGPGGGPVVKVFDGRTGQLIRYFYAYAPSFTGGVFVASADIDLDGYADIITGAGSGGGPHVEAFSGKTGQVIRSFYAYDPRFAGGVTVAAGNLDGTEDIITGPGPGGGSLVRVFDGLTSIAVQEFFAFPTFAGGVMVASADENADGVDDVVVGAGAGYGGGPVVEVLSGLNDSLLESFTAYDSRFGAGVAVAAADFTGTGAGGILTGPGALGGPDVRVFGPGVPPPLVRFNAFDPAFLGGVWVG